MSQWNLLGEQRFRALFWTQFFGAFNDNVFKNALIILITYRSLEAWGFQAQQLVIVASGIFILPFFLFSASAGQLADKYPKHVVIRWVKLFEVGVMALAAVGFFLDQVGLLMTVLFLMGFQSSIFGPSKFSILPELLSEDELVGGNALVETGTFVAILLGTIAGGILVSLPGQGALTTTLTLLGVAALGLYNSFRIPTTPAGDAGLKLSKEPFSPLVQTLRIASEGRAVFLSILGISWFWFFGAGLLSLLPSYCKDVLSGDQHVVTYCLSLFCIGIAAGSLLCERLSRHRLELGLVPFGSVGLTLFAFDLFLVGTPEAVLAPGAELLTLTQFLGHSFAWRVSFDLAMLAIFGGLFTVPLYTLMQQRSPPDRRSRVIAGNNILNALFMVLSAAALYALLSLGLSVPGLFLVLALGNLLVAVYIYGLLPEFLLRFVIWILANLTYRVRIEGREHIPNEGGCVLVCNHVTFVDWLIIGAACSRPPRFVMYHGFLRLPLLGVFFRDAKVIPIAPAHEDQGVLDEAFDRIAAELDAGEVVCIFPEGKLTKDGEMNPFRTGIERIVQRTPVPVVPMALEGLWGSFFSKKKHKPLLGRIWSKVTLRIAPPVAAGEVEARDLSKKVAALGGFAPPRTE